MFATIRSAPVAALAAIAVAGAWGTAASAQIIGLPTGADYSPYNTFAERWYDPGDWYGAPSRVGRQGGLGATSADLGRYPMRGQMSMPGSAGMAGGRNEPPGYPATGVTGRTNDPGDYSGPGPGMYPGPGGRHAAPGRGFYEEPRMTGPFGEQDHNLQPVRPSVASGSPVFQQGYTPYQGWGYSDRSRDFYDPSHGGYPARARRPAGMNFGPTGEDIGPGTDLGVPGTATGPDAGAAGAASGAAGLGDGPRGGLTGTAGTGLGTAGGEVDVAGPGSTATTPGALGRGVIVENDALYEDYDSLYGGYGDYTYVERGYLPNPSYGLGPRYRGYYSDDWYSDSAAFDEWYDAAPSARGDAGAPAGSTGGPAGGLDTSGAIGAPGAEGTTGAPGAADGLDATGVPPASRGGPTGGLDSTGVSGATDTPGAGPRDLGTPEIRDPVTPGTGEDSNPTTNVPRP